ncbi:MAG: PQQ-binding-like beta-propeller repeat protein [Limisphaerales bacterium]
MKDGKSPALILPVILLLAASAATAEDWPNFRGPNYNGISQEKDFYWEWNIRKPKLLWKVNVGIGFSSVAVSFGKVFTLGNLKDTDHVMAFNEANGKLAWSYTYPCAAGDLSNRPGPRATPTVAGDNVYTLSKLGHLLCLNFDTGQLVWSKNLVSNFGGNYPAWGFTGSPLVVGNLIITETGNEKGRSVIALNRLNGNLVWANGNDRPGYASPVPFKLGTYDGFAVFSGQAITGRLLSNGRPVWRQNWKTTDDVNAASPIIWEDKVFVSSGYGSGGALIRFGNNYSRAIWSNRYMRNKHTSCVLIGSHLYGFDEKELCCMDIANGAVKWRSKLYGAGSLTAAGDKLIVLADSGLLAVVEASPWQFKELSRVQATAGKDIWTPPVLANGAIYVRNQGQLLVVDAGRGANK